MCPLLQSIKDNWDFLTEEDKIAMSKMVEALKIKNGFTEEVREMTNSESVLKIFFPTIIKSEHLQKLIIAIYNGTWIDGYESDMCLSNKKHTGFKKDKLWDLIKKELKMTPLQMKHKILYYKASNLLIETELTVQIIAKKCGYSNHYKFINQFTKWSGESTENYRQKFGK